jgi:hypothetical protein
MNKPSINRKPRATCVLKSLGPNKQEALFEYMDGIGDEKGHTYKQCVAWLAKQGIKTNNTQLCNWRYWYIQRRIFQWCRDTVQQMMEDDQIDGQKYSDEDIQRKGNRVFSLLAIRAYDDKAWSRAQNSMGRRQRMTLLERKFEFVIKKYDDERAKEKAATAEPELTKEEKEARIDAIMGID